MLDIAVSTDEVAAEFTALTNLLFERLGGLEEFEEQRKKTAQLLAVGALYVKMMDGNPAEHHELYVKIIKQLGYDLVGH